MHVIPKCCVFRSISEFISETVSDRAKQTTIWDHMHCQGSPGKNYENLESLGKLQKKHHKICENFKKVTIL